MFKINRLDLLKTKDSMKKSGINLRTPQKYNVLVTNKRFAQLDAIVIL